MFDLLSDLLRRLSTSQNTVFCGRIQLFLARLFPLSEKSGECCLCYKKGVIFVMSQAWNKQKIWVYIGNSVHDLPNRNQTHGLASSILSKSLVKRVLKLELWFGGGSIFNTCSEEKFHMNWKNCHVISIVGPKTATIRKTIIGIFEILCSHANDMTIFFR